MGINKADFEVLVDTARCFDVRAHQRILKVCHPSMVVRATTPKEIEPYVMIGFKMLIQR